MFQNNTLFYYLNLKILPSKIHTSDNKNIPNSEYKTLK